MPIARVSDRSIDAGRARTPSQSSAQPGIRRAFLLVLTAIVLGLAGLYLVRAALVDVGGSRSAAPARRATSQTWRWNGAPGPAGR